MVIVDETTKTKQTVTNYNTYDDNDGDEIYSLDESRRLFSGSIRSVRDRKGFFRHMYPHFLPGVIEEEDEDFKSLRVDKDLQIEDFTLSAERRRQRSFRRRLFLFLTEPSSSWLSAVFFFILILLIAVSVVIMIMQTMSSFQYTPKECGFCGGEDGDFYAEDDQVSTRNEADTSSACECPPRSYPFLEEISNKILIFFAFEWTLRVIAYVPPRPKSDFIGQCGDCFNFLTTSTTLIDALAIWPHFIEELHIPGLVSLRLVRLLRVFRLLRLGSYNSIFVSLTTVFYRSLEFLKLLVVILLFGAAIFGSLMFWLEQGEWKYWEPTGNFQYIRMSTDGKTEEISPFNSIPCSFWWFVVTATTVGYGDYSPTSTAGKWVGTFAMLIGVLVIAFPVSVFSDLWSEELKQIHGLEAFEKDDSSNGDKSSYGSEEKFDQQEEIEESIDDHGRENIPRNGMNVVMNKEDLNDILTSIYTINQEQQHIQKLLKKYYIHGKKHRPNNFNTYTTA